MRRFRDGYLDLVWCIRVVEITHVMRFRYFEHQCSIFYISSCFLRFWGVCLYVGMHCLNDRNRDNSRFGIGQLKFSVIFC